MTGMDIDEGLVLDEAFATDDDTVRGMSDDECEMEEEDWTLLSAEEAKLAHAEIIDVRVDFQDDIDEFDTTMVAEYAEEIFAHMEEMEVSLPCRPLLTFQGTVMPNPNYMAFQTETDW